MHVFPESNVYYPIVVQEFFGSTELVRALMLKASPSAAAELMLRCLEIINQFWKANWRAPMRTEVGFHASIRNFGFREDRLWFLDTFPPLIGFEESEIGRLSIAFGQQVRCRVLGPLAVPMMALVTREWYSEIDAMVGVVGSSCRLRPSETRRFLTSAQSFAKTNLVSSDVDTLLSRLRSPPKLSKIWIATRFVLGREGMPNVPFEY
jgi:hypothetical protein